MDEVSSEALFQAYEETTIEIFKSENQLKDLGWKEYFVITAWNPFSKELSLTENRARNIALHQELLEMGAELLKAVGRSNDWNWFEESFAVKGISQSKMIQMAKKYQQNAIFQISIGQRKVISCID
jgi:Protein of unknown function (DUF3293)